MLLRLCVEFAGGSDAYPQMISIPLLKSKLCNCSNQWSSAAKKFVKGDCKSPQTARKGGET
jgi:hypothetical protein